MACYGLVVFAAILSVQGIIGASSPDEKVNVKRLELSAFISPVDKFARNGDFPYHVSIQKSKNYFYYHVCSGVLISEKHVLTAARCYNKDDTYVVKAGSVSQIFNDADVQSFVVTNTSVVHEKYNATEQFSDNDIALLTLDGTVNISETVKPLKLPSSNELYESSLRYTVTGWGLDDALQTELKFFKLFVMENEVCIETLKQKFARAALSNKQVCSTSAVGGIYTQDGDSGSPLVKFNKMNEAVLVGIASAVTKTTTESSDQLIFTRIPAYIDWIDQKINGASSLTIGYLTIAVLVLSTIKNWFD